MKTSAFPSLALAASLVLTGCGAGTDVPVTPEPKWSSLYATYLNKCASCHAPNAPGRTTDIEATLDFSTAAKGFTSVGGTASGLTGNQLACNGVHFVVAGHPEQSLLVASLDSPTRTGFSSGSCDETGVTDETVKQGAAPSAEWIVALKQWITSGAANN